jgi:O-antigen/teichoic acid export membrane protein
MARYVLALTEGLAVVLFPMFIGLAVTAPDFVPVVLGAQWVSMIVPLQLLGVYACFRAILPLLSQVLLVTGDEKFGSRNMMLAAVIMPIAFWAGSRWGVTGIAAAWVCVHPLIAYRLCYRALRNVGLTVSQFLSRPLWPAASASAGMAAAVYGVRMAMPAGVPAVARLGAEIGLGGVTYACILWFAHGDRIRTLQSLLATMREMHA